MQVQPTEGSRTGDFRGDQNPMVEKMVRTWQPCGHFFRKLFAFRFFGGLDFAQSTASSSHEVSPTDVR